MSNGRRQGKKAGSMEALIKELAERNLRGKNIEFSISFEKDVKYDENLMEDAICEIISNAADAMPKGGRLEISGENIRVESKNSRHVFPMNPGDYVKGF